MKRLILAALAALIPAVAIADDCSKPLTGLFTSFQANKLCSSFGSAVNSSMIPSADNTYDLGSVSKGWRTLYADTSVITPLVSAATTVGIGVAGTAEVTVGDDYLSFSGSSPAIRGGSSSIQFRSSTGANGNLTIADGGLITVARGDVAFGVSGNTIAIQEATAGAACSGTLTANGATPVVTSTTCATTGSRIFLSRTSAETAAVNAWVSAISNGVSFSITGEATDTGTYNWVIFHEAA